MMRKVTAQEIERLYEFTRQHYVEYYDIQTELVDHLATGIEERWTEHPKMDFEENLNLEFKKFGVFGFTEIVDGRRKAMGKRYSRYVWEEVKSFASKPIYIMSGIVLFIAFYSVLQVVSVSIFLSAILFILLVVFVVRDVQLRKEIKKTEKKYLFDQIIQNNFRGNSIVGLPLYLYLIFPTTLEVFGTYFKIFSVIVSLYAVYLILTFIVMLYKIPNKKDFYLKKTYPERFV